MELAVATRVRVAVSGQQCSRRRLRSARPATISTTAMSVFDVSPLVSVTEMADGGGKSPEGVERRRSWPRTFRCFPSYLDGEVLHVELQSYSRSSNVIEWVNDEDTLVSY